MSNQVLENTSYFNLAAKQADEALENPNSPLLLKLNNDQIHAAYIRRARKHKEAEIETYLFEQECARATEELIEGLNAQHALANKLYGESFTKYYDLQR